MARQMSSRPRRGSEDWHLGDPISERQDLPSLSLGENSRNSLHMDAQQQRMRLRTLDFMKGHWHNLSDSVKEDQVLACADHLFQLHWRLCFFKPEPVFLARDAHDREHLVAVKLAKDPHRILREFAILHNLGKHPGIVRCARPMRSLRGDGWVAVYQPMPTSVRQFMRRRKGSGDPLHEDLMKSYMFQLLQAVAFCHLQRVFHLNITCDHVLVGHQVVLTGFGSAVFEEELELYQPELRLECQPPEMLLGDPVIDEKTDAWALGVAMAEMAMGKIQVQRYENLQDQLEEVFMQLGTPSLESWPQMTQYPNWELTPPFHFRSSMWSRMPTAFSEDCRDMLQLLLSMNPENRPTPLQALQHPWFDDVLSPTELTRKYGWIDD